MAVLVAVAAGSCLLATLSVLVLPVVQRRVLPVVPEVP